MSKIVPVCSVINCSNNDQHKVGSTVFYFLPKDASRAIRWAEVLNEYIDKEASFTNVLICSQHFESDAFERNSKKLKPDALPSIFPHDLRQVQQKKRTNEYQIDNKNSGTSKKYKMTNLTTMVKKEEIENREIDDEDEVPQKNLIQNIKMVSNKKSAYDLQIFPSSSSCKVEDFSTAEEIIIKEEFSDSETESNIPVEDVDKYNYDAGTGDYCSNLEKSIQNLQGLKRRLIEEHEKLQQQQVDVSLKLDEVKIELKRKKAEEKECPKAEIDLLKKCFSPAQIRMLTGKLKSRWTVDDLAVAYTISGFSNIDFYRHLRTNLKFPLPAVSNINRCYQTKSKK